MKTPRLLRIILLTCLASFAAASLPSHAAILGDSDPTDNSSFGFSATQSGNLGVVGASSKDVSGSSGDEGALYVYRNLDTAEGLVTQNIKLTATSAFSGDNLGFSVSLSGNTLLAGAIGVEVGDNVNQGLAFVFRNLDTLTSDATQTSTLAPSDGGTNDQFGSSVSLVGGTGLVGSPFHNSRGGVYLYRNLDSAVGTFIENARLVPGDAANGDRFGKSVSLSGTIALVGADGSNSFQGAAYVFRNLDTAINDVPDRAKFVASDGATFQSFGQAVALSGTIGLVGAPNAGPVSDGSTGAAYLFRNLDTTVGNHIENAILKASDAATGDFFGVSVNISGTTALIGAFFADIDGKTNQGAAYFYRNLDTATGSVTETLKILASNGAKNDNFGHSVALQGDQFIIGADRFNSFQGTAYSGSIATLTTLDRPNVALAIDGISFSSAVDWIIGGTTSNNDLSLFGGNSAIVPSIVIGAGAGANSNILNVAGSIITDNITVGSTAGSSLNALLIGSAAAMDVTAYRITPGNSIFFPGSLPNITALQTFLGGSELQIWNGSAFETITTANASRVTFNVSNGFTNVALPATRVLSLSGSLAFGNRKVKSRTLKILTITNQGNSALQVTGLRLPSGFTGKFSGTIAPGRAARVTVTFRPTSKKTFRGNVTVSSNATSGTKIRAMSGKGK